MSNRRITASWTVLKAAAREGSGTTRVELQSAVRDFNKLLREMGGDGISRLTSAFEAAAEVNEILGPDEHFDYLPTSGRTGGPQHAPIQGTIMSVTSEGDRTTTRIDAVPRSQDAMRLYAPEGVVSTPTDDDAGRRAAEQFAKAVKDGSSVEVSEAWT